MSQRVITNETTISASQQRVWDLVANARGWRRWAGFSTATLEQEGSPTPDGVGAIRNFGTGPVLSREEVTIFEEPHTFGYRLLSGLPVKNYHSTVTITALDDQRCQVRWSSALDDTGLRSAAMALFIRGTLATMAKRLRSYAERHPSAAPDSSAS